MPNRCSLFSVVATLALTGLLLTPVPQVCGADLPEFPGTPTDWNGFSRYDFQVGGKSVLVVAPKQPAPGRPWVWHGEFFGHKPAPDIALLHRGFHIAYMKVPDLLGSPEAVGHWNTFYQELTQRYGLSERVALVGLSRGGLYCYNWAIANPTRVACLYGDAPVCDFKSWPGGRGKGKGSPRDWSLVLRCYGFGSDDEALAWKGNPVDQLEPLARAKVPLLHVYGDADEVVPWQENTGVVAERYQQLGGSITLIAKPGVGHHPHGLEDSTPIVDFIVRCCLPQDVAKTPVRLRILSYNIHHAEGVDGKLDVDRIAGVIRSCQPDIVALQEVDRTVQRSASADQPQLLAQRTGMQSVFGGNIPLQGGDYGNAVLTRFPIVRQKNHLLPCLDQGEQRGVLEVELAVTDAIRIVLWATHLDHRRDPQERQLSAARINELSNEAAGLPAVLAGDLNDLPDSEALQILQQNWTRTNTGSLPTIPVGEPSRQIDFILVRPAERWKIVETRVLEEAVASDHRAIFSVVELLPATDGGKH